MRPAITEELARWDELVAANPDGGNVLQARAFGEVKAKHGWEARHFMMGSVAVLMLVRRTLLGELWYVPKGPGVTDVAGLEILAKAVQAAGHKPFLVKIDPEIPKGTIKSAELAKLGFVPARNIQYNVSTVIVDLRPAEDDILASFKQKTRYNVRLAGKKGVVCEPVATSAETINLMYGLATETYVRAGVYVRSRQYFADFWRAHAESGTGQMFFARFEGEVLAAIFVTFVGTKALYKDGASSREHSDVQAMAGLQWEAMCWLKAHGVTEYDLHGVPPADRIDDPTHPLAGLARFKTGFQSQVTEYIGTYDLPLDAARYQVWRRLGERLALAYEYRVKKRLFY